jgi:hypothetical protein
MSDDTRPRPSDEPVDPADIERLREEVARLRSQIEDEVRTRRIVVVDNAGVERIRLSTEGDGCGVRLLTVDGFERLTLESDPEHGAHHTSGRSDGTGPTRVDVFAVDPEDGAGAYVGVELIDAGNSVAGFTAVESRKPRTWTAP